MRFAAALLLLVCASCAGASRPSDAEAVAQAKTRIAGATSRYGSFEVAGTGRLIDVVTLKTLDVVDVKPNQDGTADVVFNATYDVVKTFNSQSVYAYAFRNELGQQGGQVGQPLTASNVTFRFKKYDRRGWVLEE
ncbi:MAG: hypothetical protein ACYC3F_05615 [Gemmatimonadaceae bacterium]